MAYTAIKKKKMRIRKSKWFFILLQSNFDLGLGELRDNGD